MVNCRLNQFVKVILEPSAKRDIRRLDEQTKRRVISTLEDFLEGKSVDIRKMQGMEDLWRIRVGDLFTLYNLK